MGVFSCLGALFVVAESKGDWMPQGAPVCTASGDQTFPSVAPDGAGGTLVAWADQRSGPPNGYYAQHLNGAGTPLWTPDGVVVLASGATTYNDIVSDGAGGAIVVFIAFDVRAQRLNASGAIQWAASGVRLDAGPCCTTHWPRIVSDGAGGAIVVWQRDSSGTGSTDLYAQRVNASGVPQWTAGGVTVCTAVNAQYDQRVISDGAGGAIISWTDDRSGCCSDIYAQRVTSAGTPAWTANGVALCTATNVQWQPAIATDGAGGAIVTWMDFRPLGPSNFDIYAQRVNSSGTPQWTANGVGLCTTSDDQESPAIASDGAGGAIVAWADLRNGNYYDVFAQRVNGSGIRQWTVNGITICTATGGQRSNQVTWEPALQASPGG